jgi:hypothetical protein
VPLSGKHHRYAVFVCRCNQLWVPNRTAGLDNSGNAGLCHYIETVSEGEKSVAGAGPTLCSPGRFVHGQRRRIDPALLTDADPYPLAIFHEHDRVRLGMGA